MTAQIGLARLGVQLRIARAQMLLDLASKIDEVQLPDLLTFAGQIRDTTAANSLTLAAFRVAQEDALRTAQDELLLLRPWGGLAANGGSSR